VTLGSEVSAATILASDPARRTVPFGSNSLQHGTAVFEGIRCYGTQAGSAAFRLEDHLIRLLAPARALSIPHDYTLDRLREAVPGAAAGCGLADAYVRPVLYTPEPRLGVGLEAFRFTLGIEIWPAPGEAAEVLAPEPIRLTISPWRSISRATFPVGTKATGVYALAKTRAVADGFDDAVLLDPESGRVTEATIANVFLVRDQTITTPWPADSLLAGLTRDSVLTLARHLRYLTVSEPVQPGDLLAADEVFCTGTAIGLVPVAALDDRRYPDKRPVFTELWSAYQAVARGGPAVGPGWLTPIAAEPAIPGAAL
jgi:branched-chain amino acid aminotransferase